MADTKRGKRPKHVPSENEHYTLSLERLHDGVLRKGGGSVHERIRRGKNHASDHWGAPALNHQQQFKAVPSTFGSTVTPQKVLWENLPAVTLHWHF